MHNIVATESIASFTSYDLMGGYSTGAPAEWGHLEFFCSQNFTTVVFVIPCFFYMRSSDNQLGNAKDFGITGLTLYPYSSCVDLIPFQKRCIGASPCCSGQPIHAIPPGCMRIKILSPSSSTLPLEVEEKVGTISNFSVSPKNRIRFGRAQHHSSHMRTFYDLMRLCFYLDKAACS
jgi:hypothetical protein